MSGLNAPPEVVAGRRGRSRAWLRGRATPAAGDRVHARRWAILAVLCLSVFLALVDNTIVNVALPSISRQLRATTSDLQWIVDAYSLIFASLLLAGGSLGDRYGRKGALQIGLVAFAGFSAFAGLSGSTHVLIVARCLMGLAAALIFPATLAILTNTFTDARERASAVGVWTGITGLGVALGPITGGLLLLHFSWSSVFFATIPVAVVALALGAWLVPTSRDPAARGWIWPALSCRSPGWPRSSTRRSRRRRVAGLIPSPWPATAPASPCWRSSPSGSAGPASRCWTSPCSATSASVPPASRLPSRDRK